MKKIGILGGTFNPIHAGHLLLAEEVKEKLGLDHVIFIPCFLPPHKNSRDLPSAKHRLNMVKLAVSDNNDFKVSTIEIDRGGRSYSIDTMHELATSYEKGTRFYFIIGSDSVATLSSWKSIDKLIKMCIIVAVGRPGYKNGRKKGVKTLDLPTIPVSSTDIRNLIKKDVSIHYLVPDKVREYIIKNGLYKR
jgi:nicotinate-nucleotide adenylyltransferase